MNIHETQELLIKELNEHEEWFEKYEFIINEGKKLVQSKIELRKEENYLPGCQSNVWITAEMSEDRIVFRADSDAMLTRGILALILRIINHRLPQEIVGADLFFIERTGLRDRLSPSRSAGLMSIIKRCKEIAQVVLARENTTL